MLAESVDIDDSNAPQFIQDLAQLCASPGMVLPPISHAGNGGSLLGDTQVAFMRSAHFGPSTQSQEGNNGVIAAPADKKAIGVDVFPPLLAQPVQAYTPQNRLNISQVQQMQKINLTHSVNMVCRSLPYNPFDFKTQHNVQDAGRRLKSFLEKRARRAAGAQFKQKGLSLVTQASVYQSNPKIPSPVIQPDYLLCVSAKSIVTDMQQPADASASASSHQQQQYFAFKGSYGAAAAGPGSDLSRQASKQSSLGYTKSIPFAQSLPYQQSPQKVLVDSENTKQAHGLQAHKFEARCSEESVSDANGAAPTEDTEGDYTQDQEEDLQDQFPRFLFPTAAIENSYKTMADVQRWSTQHLRVRPHPVPGCTEKKFEPVVISKKDTPFSLGSAETGNSLRLEDVKRRVSRQHCMIGYDPRNACFFVQDLGSMSGTYIKIDTARVRCGMIIEFGYFEIQITSLEFLREEARVSAVVLMSKTPGLTGKEVAFVVPQNAYFRVGQDATCNYVVKYDRKVGRFHAKFYYANGQLQIIDENSPYGTWERLSFMRQPSTQFLVQDVLILRIVPYCLAIENC